MVTHLVSRRQWVALWVALALAFAISRAAGADPLRLDRDLVPTSLLYKQECGEEGWRDICGFAWSACRYVFGYC